MQALNGKKGFAESGEGKKVLNAVGRGADREGAGHGIWGLARSWPRRGRRKGPGAAAGTGISCGACFRFDAHRRRHGRRRMRRGSPWQRNNQALQMVKVNTGRDEAAPNLMRSYFEIAATGEIAKAHAACPPLTPVRRRPSSASKSTSRTTPSSPESPST